MKGKERKWKKLYMSVQQIRINNEDEEHVVASKVVAGWEELNLVQYRK